ncbi:ATP F0F1 synthase synthase [Roseovarius ramblicola]|uniref:ATP F0F1 synthase synthase n=1 Tax=Roseovarius ramblicola TaxID=2022336 RepID=A0ABV5HWT3_9RHOB
MDHVLAKVKRLRKNPYKKLISNTTLYPPIDLARVTLVDYNPDHNLDEDAWFKIDNFSDQDFFIEELRAPIDSKDCDDITKDKFDEIAFLLALQDDDIFFQKVTPSSFIKRKLICFGETVNLEVGASRIVIKGRPDAVFIRNTDQLLFRDIATVSSIFRGIDELYKEATEEQVKEFLDSEFIKLSNGYDHSMVSKPNRKRLALVADTLQNMPRDQRNNLILYIKEYCRDGIELTDDEESFNLSNDKQLKLILYGIEERFYTTQYSQEKRLANSVETMG